MILFEQSPLQILFVDLAGKVHTKLSFFRKSKNFKRTAILTTMAEPAYISILKQRNRQQQRVRQTAAPRYNDADDFDAQPRQKPIIRNQRRGAGQHADSDDDLPHLNRMPNQDVIRRRPQNIGNEFDEVEPERKPQRKPRRSLPSQSQKSLDYDPLIEFSPVKQESQHRNTTEVLEDEPYDRPQLSEISAFDEVSALKGAISDLQQQLKELEQENRRLTQANRSLQTELATLTNEARQTDQLSRQLADAERAADELRQIIKSKDASFAALDRDYKTLENDYKRLSDIRSAESDSLMMKQMEINRLQKELDQLRYSSVDYRAPPPPAMDDFAAPPRRLDVPMSAAAPPPAPAPMPMAGQPRRQGQVPAAMRDNLRFGDDSPEPPRAVYDIPVSEMPDQELRSRLQALVAEREEKERQLSRAPPKGANISHVRIQKEELDNEIVELGKRIAKLRLEMKQRGIF